MTWRPKDGWVNPYTNIISNMPSERDKKSWRSSENDFEHGADAMLSAVIKLIEEAPYQQFDAKGLATDKNDLATQRVYFISSDILKELRGEK